MTDTIMPNQAKPKRHLTEDQKQVRRVIKWSVLGVVILLGFFTFLGSFYTVDEGHVGIVKRFGKAQSQVDPGLHFKIPFIDDIQHLEVRTRKNVEEHNASTFEQMPVKAKVSVNWTINKSEAFNMYIKYGGLEQFEERILDPKLRSASKFAIAKYKAEQIIQNRGKVIEEIEKALRIAMKDFPVKLDSVQIENIVLPAKYLASIEVKQTEKNLVAAEEHRLKRQKLEAQREVNTAEAKRDAEKARADGRAYSIEKEARAEATAITVIGTAEASAITEKGKALANNATLVEYQRVVAWDGKLPETMLGGSSNFLIGLNTKKK